MGEDGGLIAGHARVLAARQLGIAEIPVMVAAAWSEAQKRAYVLADNQLAMLSRRGRGRARISASKARIAGSSMGVSPGHDSVDLLDVHGGLGRRRQPVRHQGGVALPFCQDGEMPLLHRVWCLDLRRFADALRSASARIADKFAAATQKAQILDPLDRTADVTVRPDHGSSVLR